MAERLHLAPGHREMLEGLLHEHLPDVEVWAYGSRVSGRSHDGSDLDLVLRAPGLRRIEGARLAGFREALRQSNLPFLVEARDWARLPPRFHREIEREHVVLVEREKPCAAGWTKVTLGDCVEVNDSTYSPKEGWPFINYLDTGNVTENRISKLQHLIPGKDKIPSRARRKIRQGDIVYSTVRPNHKHFGLLKEIPENLLVSTGFATIRGKKEFVHTDFIYWFLAQDCIIERLNTIAEHSTSAYPSIRSNDIERLTLSLPPLSEQRAIGDVLGVLDERIEVYRRMNQTLEAMAQALFKDWFIDFGPTRAKTAGHKPYLPKPLWNLFPNQLTNSKLGQIPEGWDVVPLPEAIELNPARSLRKGKIAPYLDMANMPTKGHSPSEVVDRGYNSGMRFINGDTLMARITPCLENGKTAYVDFLQDGIVGWGSTEYIVMRPLHPFPEEFAYYLARSDAFREFAIQSMTGTSGRQRVAVAALLQFPLPMPSFSIAREFGNLVRPLIARAGAAARETRTLAALRDTLLPNLISGKIRIQDCAGVLQSLTSSEPDSPFKGEA